MSNVYHFIYPEVQICGVQNRNAMYTTMYTTQSTTKWKGAGRHRIKKKKKLVRIK